MLKGIIEFAYLLGVHPFWVFLILILLLLLGVIKGIYVWEPKWKAKKTKDKNGNKETIYFQIRQ